MKWAVILGPPGPGPSRHGNNSLIFFERRVKVWKSLVFFKCCSHLSDFSKHIKHFSAAQAPISSAKVTSKKVTSTKIPTAQVQKTSESWFGKEQRKRFKMIQHDPTLSAKCRHVQLSQLSRKFSDV